MRFLDNLTVIKIFNNITHKFILKFNHCTQFSLGMFKENVCSEAAIF